MKLGIMQPYFLPYLGYFQLINTVDTFIVYDNIKYTKGGWINRNRYLKNSKDSYFTIPLKKDSDYLMISERSLHDQFNKTKLLNQLFNAYRKAPYLDDIFPILSEIVNFKNHNLFEFLYYSISTICTLLNVKTPLIKSSTIEHYPIEKGASRVLAVAETLKAQTYINPIGGKSLYDKDTFNRKGVELSFLNPQIKPYPQFNDQFVPDLSIIDVLMFNSIEDTQSKLQEFNLTS